MPVVLVENERTIDGLYDSWQDQTGSRYHFPNVYRTKVQPGDWFVYYRGVRTLTGRRRHPEYFGVGRIAGVERDPEVDESTPRRGWKWYCSLTDYVPFPQPVSWKRDGVTLETIKSNVFRNGVRTISHATFEDILAGAGLLDAWRVGELPRFLPRLGDGRVPKQSSQLIAPDSEEPEPTRRILQSAYRVLRDTPLARRLKELHEHRCQICGATIDLPGGQKYSEAHHIKPLGRPHNGPDVDSNILVLCPTHHVLCDYGAIELDLAALNVHPDHVISPRNVKYHNRVVVRTRRGA